MAIELIYSISNNFNDLKIFANKTQIFKKTKNFKSEMFIFANDSRSKLGLGLEVTPHPLGFRLFSVKKRILNVWYWIV